MRSSEPVGRVVAADELRHRARRLRPVAAACRRPPAAGRRPTPLGRARRAARPGTSPSRSPGPISPSGGTAAGGRAPPSTARWAGARRRPAAGRMSWKTSAEGTWTVRQPARRSFQDRSTSSQYIGNRSAEKRPTCSNALRRTIIAEPDTQLVSPLARSKDLACSQGIWRASAAATPGSPKGWRSRSNILGSGKASGFSTQKYGPSPLRASRFEPPPEPRFWPKWS